LLNLDLRSWVRVEHTDSSERMDFLGNHCSTVLSDGDSFERVIIFGGITNSPGKDIADVTSFLSNQTLILQTYQNKYGSHGDAELASF